LFGDNPLISVDTLQQLLQTKSTKELGLLVANLDDPTGLGRIVRNSQGNIEKVIEEKDATIEQRAIKEIYTGIMSAPAEFFHKWVPKITDQNMQKEYYLTDLVGMAVANAWPIMSCESRCAEEVQGINDRVQLAQAERFYQANKIKNLMLQGVTFRDPERVDIRGDVQIASDVIIDVGVILEGKVTIGRGSIIGPYSCLKDVHIAENVNIKSHCVIEGAVIENQCAIGPFARIRPGTELAEQAQVGNFAEIKNSKLGKGSKSHHVSYLGDATIEEDVNIGAGTITCNYDGCNKHQTKIGKGAFIGSNSSLVAPVVIGPGAFIAAGSTITRDAPPEKLTIGRAKQLTIEDWQKPVKKKKEN
jgi:bifunctional UDP-N-acetylglucosamine pyrophosphorylase / glucosamine-1-phosphate N-acetyltransferase